MMEHMFIGGVFIAEQYHVTHSSSIGAGIVSGGPFYCWLIIISYLINYLLSQTTTITFVTEKSIEPVLIFHVLNDMQ